MMLKAILFVILSTRCRLSYTEEVFRNFRCITYNWNINMTCRWDEPTGYRGGLTTDITWYLKGFTKTETNKSNCPRRTRSSCTWSLGANGESYDIDPDREISICLQLRTHNGDSVSRRECRDVDIANEVQPEPVSHVEAIFTSPRCLNITWTHENTIDVKIYSLQLSSDQEDLDFEFESKEDRQKEYYNVCNLTYHTRYTVSVKTRPLNLAGFPTGYWSKRTVLHKVTPNTVPARPPELLPGAYTFAPVNIKGYRTVTVYWSGLPQSSWNGANLTYVIRVRPVEPCGQQTSNIQKVETFCKLQVLSNCSYNISVWSKNEVGQSDEPSRMYIQHKGLNLPQDIFIKAKNHTEEVEISWTPPVKADSMTVYWCQRDPGRTCRSGFYHKTVSSRYNSTSVYLKGFPEVVYIFGVSAERKQQGQIVSSGFQWTDCSAMFSRVLESPEITFVGFPEEEMVSVSWTYSYCNRLVLEELLYRTEYQVKVRTSVQPYSQLLDGNGSVVYVYNVPSGVKVCVSIMATLNRSVPLAASPVKCYTQGQQGGSRFLVKTIVVVLCSIIGLPVIIVLVCVTRKICKWWREEIPINLPSNTGDGFRQPLNRETNI